MKKKIIITLGVVMLFLIIAAIHGKTQNKIVSAEIIIDAPKEKVWEVWCKFDNVENYVPMIHEAETVGEISEGLGQCRRCDISEDVHVEEKITSWTPGESYSMEVYKTEGVLIDKMNVSFSIAKNNDKTKATIKMEYKMAGLADYIPMLGMMENQAVEHLVGLKHFVETENKLNADLIEELLIKYKNSYKILN